MISVVVDIDNTLVDTMKRTQKIWKLVLGREIPQEEAESLTPRGIFEKHASWEQKASIDELRREFNDVLLCRNKEGIRLLGLD